MSIAEQMADISSHQATDHGGSVVLANYAGSGRTRLLLKATEGDGYENPYFAGWWMEAHRLGLACGAYHFARTRVSAHANFATLVSAVGHAGGLRPGDWLGVDLAHTD